MVSTDTTTENSIPQPVLGTSDNASRIGHTKREGFQMQQGSIIETDNSGKVASVSPNMVNADKNEIDQVYARVGKTLTTVLTMDGANVDTVELENHIPGVLNKPREIKNVTPVAPSPEIPSTQIQKLTWLQKLNPFRKKG